MLFDDLTRSGNEFQRVGTTWVLSLGTDSKWKPDERSSLGLVHRENMENRYDGSLEERVWCHRVWEWCEIEQQWSVFRSGTEWDNEETVWQP